MQTWYYVAYWCFAGVAPVMGEMVPTNHSWVRFQYCGKTHLGKKNVVVFATRYEAEESIRHRLKRDEKQRLERKARTGE